MIYIQSLTYEAYPNDGVLIDLENPSIYQEWHLPGAVNIPLDELLYTFQRVLTKDKKYYLYCRMGNKSRRACQILEMYGYQVKQVLISQKND